MNAGESIRTTVTNEVDSRQQSSGMTVGGGLRLSVRGRTWDFNFYITELTVSEQENYNTDSQQRLFPCDFNGKSSAMTMGVGDSWFEQQEDYNERPVKIKVRCSLIFLYTQQSVGYNFWQNTIIKKEEFL